MGLYQSAQWRNHIRPAILERDNWTCQMCGAFLRGGRSDKASTIIRPAVIDHLIPAELRPDLATDTDNLWAICCNCHDGPCQAIGKRKGLTGEQIRQAKIDYRVIGLDGYAMAPKGRYVDRANEI